MGGMELVMRAQASGTLPPTHSDWRKARAHLVALVLGHVSIGDKPPSYQPPQAALSGTQCGCSFCSSGYWGLWGRNPNPHASICRGALEATGEASAGFCNPHIPITAGAGPHGGQAVSLPPCRSTEQLLVCSRRGKNS